MAVIQRPESLGLALMVTVGSGVMIAKLASGRESVVVAVSGIALYGACLAVASIWAARRIRQAQIAGEPTKPQARPLTVATRVALVSVPVVLLSSPVKDTFTWLVICLGGLLAGLLGAAAFLGRRDPTRGPFVGMN